MKVVSPGEYQIAKHIRNLFPDIPAEKVAVRREGQQWIVKIDTPAKLIEVEADTVGEMITALTASSKIAAAFAEQANTDAPQ